MEFKQQLQDTLNKLRVAHSLSDGPTSNGLMLRYNNDKDWALVYKCVQYTPKDFTDLGFPERVVLGKGEETTEEAMLEKTGQVETVEFEKTKINTDEVRPGSYPTTNLLLIFDAEGNDISEECTEKRYKQDLHDIYTKIYHKDKHIANRKNVEITIVDETYTKMVAFDVPKTALKEKAQELQALVKAELEKRKEVPQETEPEENVPVESFDEKKLEPVANPIKEPEEDNKDKKKTEKKGKK